MGGALRASRCPSLSTPQPPELCSRPRLCHTQAQAGEESFHGIQRLKPGQKVDYIKAPANANAMRAIVFYYDAKAKVYKQVEGPTLVDTAKGGFVVDPFDPTPAAYASPYDTFKALPTV